MQPNWEQTDLGSILNSSDSVVFFSCASCTVLSSTSDSSVLAYFSMIANMLSNIFELLQQINRRTDGHSKPWKHIVSHRPEKYSSFGLISRPRLDCIGVTGSGLSMTVPHYNRQWQCTVIRIQSHWKATASSNTFSYCSDMLLLCEWWDAFIRVTDDILRYQHHPKWLVTGGDTDVNCDDIREKRCMH